MNAEVSSHLSGVRVLPPGEKEPAGTSISWKCVRLERDVDVAHLRREGADVTAHPGSPDVEPA